MEITAEKMRWMYRKMLEIRRFEERVSRLYAEGYIPGFVHLCIGQEACAVGTCAALQEDDYIASTHRGHGHHIARGARFDRMMAELFGKETGYCRGRGGCLHITDMGGGSLGAMGIVGASLVIAPGAGLSSRMLGNGRVAACFFGEGATNQGMFHEGVNLAAAWKLPVVFLCENNLYGEATPQRETMLLADVAERAGAYGIPGVCVDGNDVLAVYRAVSEAVERARRGGGPTLVECKTYRWHGHYEGDPETYRTAEEVEEWKRKCPVARFREHLLATGVLTAELDARIEQEVATELDAAMAFADESPFPAPETLRRDIWAPDYVPAPDLVAAASSPQRELKTGLVAIQEALREEMERDPRVVLLGQDLKQAIFGVCTPLAEEFGEERVRNTPISEAAIIGCAIGAAMTGLRPVAEIMFQDFLLCCMDGLVNQAPKLRYMTGGQAKVPLVVRVPGGSGLSAGAQHSQSLEAIFLHFPGIKVACPSTPADMKGLLKAAIRDDNPVIFFEHKTLYYEGGEVPAGEYVVPFGVADVKRPGEDVTVVAVLAMVPRALQAAEMLAREGISVEVIDPRTLVPLDAEAIISSVRKTSRLVIVEEGMLTGGVGGEIAAIVAERALEYLDAPIIRVAAPDTPIPFSPALEEHVAPTVERIAAAARRVMGRDA